MFMTHPAQGAPRAKALPLLIALAFLLSSPASDLFAQRNRVTGAVDGNKRAFLKGSMHPKAVAENDEGPADADMELRNVTIVMKQSDAQQADLTELLTQQQDPASPNYHKW